MIHAFDDPQIIAAQGVIGLEILEDLPNVDEIYVPIGGGGLAGGLRRSPPDRGAGRPPARRGAARRSHLPAVRRAARRRQIPLHENMGAASIFGRAQTR